MSLYWFMTLHMVAVTFIQYQSLIQCLGNHSLRLLVILASNLSYLHAIGISCSLSTKLSLAVWYLRGAQHLTCSGSWHPAWQAWYCGRQVEAAAGGLSPQTPQPPYTMPRWIWYWSSRSYSESSFLSLHRESNLFETDWTLLQFWQWCIYWRSRVLTFNFWERCYWKANDGTQPSTAGSVFQTWISPSEWLRYFMKDNI